VIATQTLQPIHQLTFEEISHDGIIFLPVVFMPFLRLLSNSKPVKFHLLVFWLAGYAVELVMHPVEHKTQELLRVLLAISLKLRYSSRNLIFQIARSN